MRDASPGDWPLVRELLSAAALPTEDLGPDMLGEFLVAGSDSANETGLVGLVGLECLSPFGLLRSLVVADSFRGQNLGTTLLECIERRAKDAQLTELWLLTTDAESFFSRHGFRTMDRANAPDEIRNTQEFSSLCPGDAVLMRKIVDGVTAQDVSH